MNKKIIRALFVAAAIALPSIARADSCSTVLCLAGMLQGSSGGDACSGPISDYFSIVRFGKHHSFAAAATAAARLGFLNECSDADSSWISEINSAYGTVH